MRNTKVIKSTLLLAVASSLLMGCGSAAQSPSPTSSDSTGGTQGGEEVAATCEGPFDSVLSAGPTMPVTTAMYTSVPQELGYWNDVGIDINVDRVPTGNLALVQRFAANDGIDAAGIAGQAGLLLAEQGVDFQAVMATIPINYNSIRVLEDSDITSLKDLEGKKIGVLDPEASAIPVVKGVLTLQGVDAESVEFVGTGIGQSAVQALKQKEVDALALFDSAWAPDHMWPMAHRTVDEGLWKEFGPAIFLAVKEETIENCYNELIEYGKGIIKGSLFALENPEAAVQIHWKYYPETAPEGVDREVALKDAVEQLERRNSLYVEVDGLWGNTDGQKWEKLMEISKAGGELSADISLDTFWNPSLLPAMNDFDQDEVRSSAREFKFQE